MGQNRLHRSEPQGIYVFGSLVYRDGAQFNDESDVDLAIVMPEIPDAADRADWLEALLRHKLLLEGGNVVMAVPRPTVSGSEARLADDLTIQIGRFDAKLNASGLGESWQNRCDINEAVKAILMDGALVDLPDLVLHDANMNKRSPTIDLARAASALKARRVSRQRPAPWPLTHEGLASVAGGLAPKREAPAPETPIAKKVTDWIMIRTRSPVSSLKLTRGSSAQAKSFAERLSPREIDRH